MSVTRPSVGVDMALIMYVTVKLMHVLNQRHYLQDHKANLFK